MRFVPTLLVFFLALAANAQEYVPSEDNLQARKDFSSERFGIFLHWGIYSSYAQGEWYLNVGKLNKDEYAKAAGSFYPSQFNADEWVKAFKDAGAGYITITSRHHDGFSMFNSSATDYDIVDATPYGHDVMSDLDKACQKEGLKLHFYYSLVDWIREDYPIGEFGRLTGRKGDRQDYGHYFDFMKCQIKELLTNYNTSALWLDGYWDHDKDESPFDWRIRELYDHIHTINPACLIGNNHHRMPLEGEDFVMYEDDLPGENKNGLSGGQKIIDTLPMETCQTMNNSWGYEVKDLDYRPVGDLIKQLATCVSMNCNLLLNIGPRADGSLPEGALKCLKGIGEWMRLNGESIKGCGYGPVGKSDWGVTTAPAGDPKTFYIHVFKHPGDAIEIPIPQKSRIKNAIALADGSEISARKNGDKLIVNLADDLSTDSDYVIKVSLR